ncbi:type IV toxin-antitoxin system AbiEi family antitoxin domain-containing protein [Amycolatopsis sp.]|uniref:type IV toxin-antitoxin system AbiEi family antitoxin domain-containing protein n=1 Tax=Amycolatopsis sp. TaxID=37632 RepID=UPI002DFAC86F|nr:type IV toxin-antitoxin system AbiEi family antitoxin [Amycolatopsis sp.]
MARTAIGVPPQLTRRAHRIFRPRDLAGIYAHPRAEVSRLTRIGAVQRLATGYYALVPQHRLGDPTWVPDLNAVALGIGQADYGTDAVALMGVSAARIHGAILRGLAVAVLAVPKQRPPLRTGNSLIVFTERDVSRLDVERTETELGPGWATTPEQTALDLAARPTLGGIEASDAEEAIRALAQRMDWAAFEDLAATQHHPKALAAARTITGSTHLLDPAELLMGKATVACLKRRVGDVEHPRRAL